MVINLLMLTLYIFCNVGLHSVLAFACAQRRLRRIPFSNGTAVTFVRCRTVTALEKMECNTIHQPNIMLALKGTITESVHV